MTRVAAIQMQGKVGDIEYNLSHIKQLIEEAIEQGAEVIALPEFFTTPIVLDEIIRQCALPPDNPALDLLKYFATKHKVTIGGSYLEQRDDDVFNCYTLVRSNGKVTRHDKDLPTMVENAFYIGGQTLGVHDTSIGCIGTAVCWETIRTQTVDRLAGNIDFLMTGSHWWSIPNNWKIGADFLKRSAKKNQTIMEETPARLAKILGVANIHAAHCGTLTGELAILPNNIWNSDYTTELIGETQIVDKYGNILQRMSRQDGPGVIVADLDLSKGSATLPRPSGFWIPKLPLRMKMLWWWQNAVSKGHYKPPKKPTS